MTENTLTDNRALNPRYPNLNVPLLRRAVEWVEHQAELDLCKREWDQGVWFDNLDLARELMQEQPLASKTDSMLRAEQRSECGTAYCFAGWVVQTHAAEAKGTLKFPYGFGRHAGATQVQVNGGPPEFWDDAASKALGLPLDWEYRLDQEGLYDNEQLDLYVATNTAEDIRRIAEWLAGHPL